MIRDMNSGVFKELRSLLHHIGVSQATFCECIGVSRITFLNWQRRSTVSPLEAIALTKIIAFIREVEREGRFGESRAENNKIFKELFNARFS